MELTWLPKSAEWSVSRNAALKSCAPEAAPRLVELANSRIDFIQTAKLDRLLSDFGSVLKQHLKKAAPARLAVVGSSTLAHLVPAIRVAALRRGFWVDVFEGRYGMYRQELADPHSELYAFRPDVLLLALDAHHIAAGSSASVEAAMGLMQSCWKLAQEQLGATVIQQTVLPVFPCLMGNNEHRMDSSPAALVAEINRRLRDPAAANGVHLLAVDALAQRHGIGALFDPVLWHQAKQEIHPKAAPLWGDHVGRLLGVLRGISCKCLVLDLDNTLWGGVIGDDGLEGIVLGQGDAVGEAYVSFQKYVAALSQRGVLLAICSKNDDANARAVFERHPDMVLRLKDIACFVANWQDKASNLRLIAEKLNIGLDSLVFVDDNPFERNLVRQELPSVAVPELPDDPAGYADTIAAAGYFEALALTSEDRERAGQYRANVEREQLRESATDMDGYLRGLGMELVWAPFDAIGLARIAQLVNKSNQFNLTTRRYTQEQLAGIMCDPSCLTLQLRLRDRFGDNGTIAIVIGRMGKDRTLELDSWLMSCRVLGRQVEEATLNLIVERARSHGLERLIGRYLPTSKNSMVKTHYGKLGFGPVSSSEDGSGVWSLEIAEYQTKPTHIQTKEGALDQRTDLLATH